MTAFTHSYPNEPVWWILTRNLPQHAQRVALRQLDHKTGAEIRTLTYGELVDAAQQLAAGLHRLGIGKGDRVALFTPNLPEMVVAYFGIWMAGAVVVPCNFMYKHAELLHQLSDAGACLLLAPAGLYDTAKQVAVSAGVRLVVIPQQGCGPSAAAPDDLSFADLLAESPAQELPQAEPQDLALLLYTGGTTGRSKGAMITHHNLVANTVQFSMWYQMEPGAETCISVLPLCHSGGMSGAMTVPLYAGATMLLLQRFDPAVVVGAIAEYRATRFFGVPTMYTAILESQASKTCDLSSLRSCRTGASPLPVAVKMAFDRLAGREILVEGYGLSETSPLALANPLMRPKAGSVGIPLPDTEAMIVDVETGHPVPPGVTGELLVRGPQVMKGYWNQPEETAAALSDGWLHTGDIARTDEEGYYYIVDRKKDMINSAGFKIWPREVEEVLYSHADVQLAAVVGAPDAYRGEATVAFVVRKSSMVTEAELIEHCRQYLANYKVPRAIHFRTELPLSVAGKILRRELRATLSATD